MTTPTRPPTRPPTPTELASTIETEARNNALYQRAIMLKKRGTNEYAHYASTLAQDFPTMTASIRYYSAEDGDTERNRQSRALKIVRPQLAKAKEHKNSDAASASGLSIYVANMNLDDDVSMISLETHQEPGEEARKPAPRGPRGPRGRGGGNGIPLQTISENEVAVQQLVRQKTGKAIQERINLTLQEIKQLEDLNDPDLEAELKEAKYVLHRLYKERKSLNKGGDLTMSDEE